LAVAIGLCFIATGATRDGPVAETSHDVRMVLGDETSFVIRLTGDRMRMARSVEGLANAELIRGTHRLAGDGVYLANYPARFLPIAEDELPENTQWVQVGLTLQIVPETIRDRAPELRNTLMIQWTVWGGDERRGRWQLDAFDTVRFEPDAHAAPEVTVPRLDDLDLAMTTGVDPEAMTLGVSLLLRSQDLPVTQLLRNGRPIEANVRITDGEGRLLTEETDDLSAFYPPPGDGSAWVAELTRGGPITCVATLGASPTGDLPTARQTVTTRAVAGEGPEGPAPGRPQPDPEGSTREY
jgi:hypothetical protein